MMSPESIRALSREAAQRAAKRGLCPLIVESDDIGTTGNLDMLTQHLFSLPNFGEYVPDGWELTDDVVQVDKTGVGGDYEAALTIDQFSAYVATHGPGSGYAMIEEGPFQVWVGRFVRCE